MKFIKKQFSDIRKNGVREFYKKVLIFIEFFYKSPLFIFALFVCLLMRLLKPIIWIRVDCLPAPNFGEFIMYVGTYYCKHQQNNSKNSSLDLFFINPKVKVYNRQLKKMWKRKINILPGFLFDPIYKINNIFPDKKNFTIPYISSDYERDLDNLFLKYKPLEFTQEEEEKGLELMNRLGIQKNDKFVCLNVRDSGYQSKKIPDKYHDWSYHDYKHNNIENFKLCAEELSKRGYYVVRMGVNVKTKFNLQNNKIIDYANSKIRSDFMDIFLCSKCTFAISTASGFVELPILFRKPLVQISTPLAALQSHNNNFVSLMKHHLKNNKRMSLSEIFSSGAAFILSTKAFQDLGIKLEDNSPEEIQDVVMDMFNIVENLKKDSKIEQEMQNKFRSLFDENYKKYRHLGTSKYWKKYKHHKIIRASYSAKFLEKNKYWLN